MKKILLLLLFLTFTALASGYTQGTNYTLRSNLKKELKVSGAQPMQGDLLMGGFDIVNMGSLKELGELTAGSINANSLTVDSIDANSLTVADLTETRVVFVGAGGLLVDDADLTFVTDTLFGVNCTFSGVVQGGTLSKIVSTGNSQFLIEATGGTGKTMSFGAFQGSDVIYFDNTGVFHLASALKSDMLAGTPFANDVIMLEVNASGFNFLTFPLRTSGTVTSGGLIIPDLGLISTTSFLGAIQIAADGKVRLNGDLLVIGDTQLDGAVQLSGLTGPGSLYIDINEVVNVGAPADGLFGFWDRDDATDTLTTGTTGDDLELGGDLDANGNITTVGSLNCSVLNVTGTGTDAIMNFAGSSVNTGIWRWESDNNRFVLDELLKISGANEIQFRTIGQTIGSPSAGVLRLEADTSIDLRTATNIGNGTDELVVSAAGGLSFKGTSKIDWSELRDVADSITTVTGTGAGALATIQTKYDDSYYHVDEVVGGMEVIFDFENVTGFNRFEVSYYYAGSSAHLGIANEIYNWTTTSWDRYSFCPYFSTQQLTLREDMCTKQTMVPDDVDYIGTGGDAGNVRIRLMHYKGGNGAHDLDIDFIALYQ